eukprot:953954-Rhodomonas_salina.2
MRHPSHSGGRHARHGPAPPRPPPCRSRHAAQLRTNFPPIHRYGVAAEQPPSVCTCWQPSSVDLLVEQVLIPGRSLLRMRHEGSGAKTTRQNSFMRTIKSLQTVCWFKWISQWYAHALNMLNRVVRFSHASRSTRSFSSSSDQDGGSRRKTVDEQEVSKFGAIGSGAKFFVQMPHAHAKHE